MPALPLDFLVAALVTLFMVVDPIGLTPAFIGLTAGLPRSARRQVALRAALIAFGILTGAALIGDWLLRRSAAQQRRDTAHGDAAVLPFRPLGLHLHVLFAVSL